MAPVLVVRLPHDALTNLAYPSLPANVFGEGQIRPVTYEIYFPPRRPTGKVLTDVIATGDVERCMTG